MSLSIGMEISLLCDVGHISWTDREREGFPLERWIGARTLARPCDQANPLPTTIPNQLDTIISCHAFFVQEGPDPVFAPSDGEGPQQEGVQSSCIYRSLCLPSRPLRFWISAPRPLKRQPNCVLLIHIHLVRSVFIGVKLALQFPGYERENACISSRSSNHIPIHLCCNQWLESISEPLTITPIGSLFWLLTRLQ